MKRDADAAFGSQAGPSSISLPSPPADSQSPAPETPESESAGPSRKRSRSEVTPEERKEARAHRNRIAAQNSRDRRKAQFSYLEQRVSELEEENRKLRAGMSLAELSRSVEPSHEQRERELARERENAELKEKIKTLENGWEAVMKALAASGLPISLPPAPSTSSSSSAPPPSSDSTSQPSTTTFPVIIPPNPVFPLSPAPTASPALSSHVDFDETDSTRHLAAGGFGQTHLQLELPSSTPYPTPTPDSLSPETASAADEMAMEDLFREILAPSPSIASAPLPSGLSNGEASSPSQVTSAVAAPSMITIPAAESVDWAGEAEMQRLLDLLPLVQSDVNCSVMDGDADANAVEFPSALELDLTGWDISSLIQHPPYAAIGAF
ncbi:hypothetical protein BXZ70DRAFT_913051 [Cristinia sonorae]|uniref:X-box-binding protein 1 n=1 Tax=Cristinia sonorae TaxID=1940300 RepID=A0A8K0UZI8_9AGAR|nr:hypothetical protein BXZ70DRAFT_913051 [Cristinia sonorae]